MTGFTTGVFVVSDRLRLHVWVNFREQGRSEKDGKRTIENDFSEKRGNN